MSWIEALFILPAHLRRRAWPPGAPVRPGPLGRRGAGLRSSGVLHPVQRGFAGGLAWFTRTVYGPVLTACAELALCDRR